METLTIVVTMVVIVLILKAIFWTIPDDVTLYRIVVLWFILLFLPMFIWLAFMAVPGMFLVMLFFKNRDSEND